MYASNLKKVLRSRRKQSTERVFIIPFEIKLEGKWDCWYDDEWANRTCKKINRTLDIVPEYEVTSSQKHSGMSRVVKGSRSFTCHPRVYPRMLWIIHLPLPSQPKLSFSDPRRMEGWVGLGTTTVSEQSAQDCYVADITVVSCANRHDSRNMNNH